MSHKLNGTEIKPDAHFEKTNIRIARSDPAQYTDVTKHYYYMKQFTK